ncbi:MAG: hypothetical protein ACLFN9_02575, partial [Desulfococcaceae bacterium]
FFVELKEEEGRADRMTAYLRTHPLSGDRVEHIAEYAREKEYVVEARQNPLPAALRSVPENQE